MKKKNSTSQILLSVIAIIAIIWYIFNVFSFFHYWYALPIMATLTGIFSVWIIPGVSQKLKQVNSIIATGLAIMGFQIFSNFVTKDKTWVMHFIIITIVSIFIDIYSYKHFNIADAIFDIGISCISVWLLSQTNYWLLILILLLINFIVVLTVNFNFRFSIKSEKNKKPKSNTSNTANKSE